MTTAMTGLVPDVVEVRVPLGARVVVASDLHLPAEATSTSLAAADDLAWRLMDGEAPTTLVLAGDFLEMLPLIGRFCPSPAEAVSPAS